MAKNEANIHAYGDLANAVYVADMGTTLPSDLSEPGAGIEEIGWISEDGLSEAVDQSDETYRAWQGATIVKKSITSSDRTFTFSALEENAITQGLKYRGQEATAAGDVSTIKVQDQTKTDERAWVIDLFDGNHQKRYVIPKGFYVVSGEQTYAASGLTMLEITVTPIGDYDEISKADSAGA